MGMTILTSQGESDNEIIVNNFCYKCDICGKEERTKTTKLPFLWSKHIYSSGLPEFYCKECSKSMDESVFKSRKKLKQHLDNLQEICEYYKKKQYDGADYIPKYSKGDNVNESDKN